MIVDEFYRISLRTFLERRTEKFKRRGIILAVLNNKEIRLTNDDISGEQVHRRCDKEHQSM